MLFVKLKFLLDLIIVVYESLMMTLIILMIHSVVRVRTCLFGATINMAKVKLVANINFWFRLIFGKIRCMIDFFIFVMLRFTFDGGKEKRIFGNFNPKI